MLMDSAFTKGQSLPSRLQRQHLPQGLHGNLDGHLLQQDLVLAGPQGTSTSAISSHLQRAYISSKLTGCCMGYPPYTP